MNINRSGYYKWLSRRFNPSIREINRIDACRIFDDYHNKYPSHGYRWLNAKIRLDLGVIYSDNYSFLELNLNLNMLKDMVKKEVEK